MNKNFEYLEHFKYLDDAVVNITDDCNLQCKYCFVEQNPHYMSLDTAKAVADYLYENNQKKIKLNITPKDRKAHFYFFGGEPMLCYKSIIVPLVEYCNTKYPQHFTFGITTNGTLLTKESIDFFKKNNFGVMLSMDGIRESQEYNRPCKNCHLSSFDLVEKNIKYLLEQIPRTVYRSTAYGPTIHHFFENYKYADSLGVKVWACIADQRSTWTDEQKKIFANEILKTYLYRLDQVIHHITPMYSWRHAFWLYNTTLLLDQETKNYEIDYQNMFKRCGLGTVIGSIGWDGSIYGCQEQVSKENKNIFYIGNIFEGGINQQKHEKLLNQYYLEYTQKNDQKESCKNCFLRKACNAGLLICPSANSEIFNNLITSITDINCLLRQEYTKNSLISLSVLTEIAKEDDFIQEFLKQEIQGRKENY